METSDNKMGPSQVLVIPVDLARTKYLIWNEYIVNSIYNLMWVRMKY